MENSNETNETEAVKFSMRNLRAGKINSPVAENSTTVGTQMFFTQEELLYRDDLEAAIKNDSNNTKHIAEFQIKFELLAPRSWSSTRTFQPTQQEYAEALEKKFQKLGVQAYYFFDHHKNEIRGFIGKAATTQEAEQTVGTIIKSCRDPIQIGKTWVWLNCIAACVLLEDAEDPTIESLDNALTQTLQTTSSKAPFMMYSSYLKDRRSRDQELAAEIRRRIENKTCKVLYTPTYSTTSKKLLGFTTALQGFEYQDQTIDSKTIYACAESNQLLANLQQFVFAEALNDFARWSKVKQISGAQLWLQTGIGALADPLMTSYVKEQAKKYPPLSIGMTIGNTKCLAQPLVQNVLAELSATNIMLSVSNVDPREDTLRLFAQQQYHKIGLHPHFVRSVEKENTVTQHFYIDLAQRSQTDIEAGEIATPENLETAQKLGATTISGPLFSGSLDAQKIDELLSNRSSLLRT